MRLKQLLQDMTLVGSFQDCDITRLTTDSRQVQIGDLFIAIPGDHVDGRRFIGEACVRGARAIVYEPTTAKFDESMRPDGFAIPFVPVAQLSQHLGSIAARFYGHPAKKLRVLGVTGTNGKTSCTHFLAQLLKQFHHQCGLIGTLGNGFFPDLQPSPYTTPDAVCLQETLSGMVKAGAEAVAMEVSSHSISQGRINAIDFETAIFTNLTQDHLDYHGTMENYAAVKRTFMADMPVTHRVINAEDDYGAAWLKLLAGRRHLYAFSTQNRRHPIGIPTIYCDKVVCTLQGITAQVYSPWGNGTLCVPLMGTFNLSNILAVTATLCLYGMPFNEVIASLKHIQSVPGRMQMLGGRDKPLVIVDYAHSPDALMKTLQTLREHTLGKLRCVFGCGGERDVSKRPLMAQIVERWADQVIVTNDNPRHEDPEKIVADIRAGFKQPEKVQVMLNRSHAIKNSIQWAKSGDVILVAGKGAEQYQQIGDDRIPFNDAEVVKRYLHLENANDVAG